MVFIIVPVNEKNATPQIAFSENDRIWGNTISALDRTIAVKNDNTSMLIIATSFILGGYFPGNFPPIDASPQGIPAARQSWKMITIPDKKVKMYAEIIILNNEV